MKWKINKRINNFLYSWKNCRCITKGRQRVVKYTSFLQSNSCYWYMPTKSMKNPFRKLEKINSLKTILDLGSPAIQGFIPPHMVHLHLMSCGSQVNVAPHIDFAQTFWGHVPKFIAILNIENWVMTLATKLSCKFAGHETLNLLGVISRQILMYLTLDLKQPRFHPPLLLFQNFFGLICFRIPQWFNILTQSHTPIFRLLVDSQWNIMLFLEKLLCYTFALCNSDMNHTEAHDNLDLIFQNLSTYPIVAIWSDPYTQCCHLVDELYLGYTFLEEFPHSSIACRPPLVSLLINQYLMKLGWEFFETNALTLDWIRVACRLVVLSKGRHSSSSNLALAISWPPIFSS